VLLVLLAVMVPEAAVDAASRDLGRVPLAGAAGALLAAALVATAPPDLDRVWTSAATSDTASVSLLSIVAAAPVDLDRVLPAGPDGLVSMSVATVKALLDLDRRPFAGTAGLVAELLVAATPPDFDRVLFAGPGGLVPQDAMETGPLDLDLEPVAGTAGLVLRGFGCLPMPRLLSTSSSTRAPRGQGLLRDGSRLGLA